MSFITISRLADGLDKDYIEKVFSQYDKAFIYRYGEILDSSHVNRTTILIRYERKESCILAVENLNGIILFGVSIKVVPGKNYHAGKKVYDK